MTTDHPTLDDGLTVIGNAAIDSIDGADWQAGGGPTYSLRAYEALGARPRLVTSYAERDAHLFTERFAGSELTVCPEPTTTTCLITNREPHRLIRFRATGHRWTRDDMLRHPIGTRRVHVAPLLRQDFAVEAIEELAKRHIVSYDAHGLVRTVVSGALTLDEAFDPEILRHVTILKLADVEAEIITPGAFTAETARSLGVPEILVTHGVAGTTVYYDNAVVTLDAERSVPGEATGAGDLMITAYGLRRALGDPPPLAARNAMRIVETDLVSRRTDVPEPTSS